MKEKLRPCPFCGRDAVVLRITNALFPNSTYFKVRCNCCGGRTATYKLKKHAVYNWNARQ